MKDVRLFDDRSGSCRKVEPESIEAVGSSEQSRENGAVDQHDMASPRTFWRHPKERVEFSVAGSCEGMRLGHVDRLLR